MADKLQHQIAGSLENDQRFTHVIFFQMPSRHHGGTARWRTAGLLAGLVVRNGNGRRLRNRVAGVFGRRVDHGADAVLPGAHAEARGWGALPAHADTLVPTIFYFQSNPHSSKAAIEPSLINPECLIDGFMLSIPGLGY
ncbi:MAG: hypothetical protein ABIT83_07155 [Massilia sp.]